MTGATVAALERIAVAGTPNCGKTTLFNRLCGARAKTANFPGTTVEARVGRSGGFELVDLPGHYGLNLDRPESRFCRDYLAGELARAPRPDALLVVVDATNLARELIFTSQALQQGLPAVVALNMIDCARRCGLTIDVDALSARLGCPVVPVCARTGEGFDALRETLRGARATDASLPDPTVAETAAAWAGDVAAACVAGRGAVEGTDRLTDRLDGVLTHPVAGTLIFAAVMTALFSTIFMLATVPMDLIELIFASAADRVAAIVPPGAVRELLVDGVIAGIAGTVVFLPQIVLLFFLISLLEDTGYLGRAVFVTDRLLRRFGLPGQAFVPLLSAHACAIPAIMSARLVPDRRERLATILVAPLMSCSARLPVYVLLIGVLFGDRPLLAGLAFTGCYALGVIVALLSALLARRTILQGPSRPIVIELPAYRLPSIRGAVLTTIDRAAVFLRKAGTVIVAICIVLWWLGEYPHVPPPAEAQRMRATAAEIAPLEPERAAALGAEADALVARDAQARSFIGRIGRATEPLFAPLGYDWQITIGIISSFAAREVFVSTMAVVLSGSDPDEHAEDALRERIAGAARGDGAPLFTPATAASLLVFYVLAMQCLPTLAVTRRETGSWWWALLQLGYMSAIAYIAALLVYRGLGWMGVG